MKGTHSKGSSSSSSVQAPRSGTTRHRPPRIHTAHSSTPASCRRQVRIQCQATRPNATAAAATTATATIASPRAPSNDTSTLPLGHQLLLKDPAEIGARGTATASIRDMGGDLSIHTYMTLPVEQYYILDPSKVQFLAGNRFILSVPRLQLLGASLQPVIEVQVRSEPDAVVLEATDCKLNATGIMSVLESSCNSVLTGLVNSLLPWFMRQLAADYQKWAADAGYRAARQARSSQKHLES
eukprot:gene4128-4374_t